MCVKKCRIQSFDNNYNPRETEKLKSFEKNKEFVAEKNKRNCFSGEQLGISVDPRICFYFSAGNHVNTFYDLDQGIIRQVSNGFGDERCKDVRSASHRSAISLLNPMVESVFTYKLERKNAQYMYK